MHLTTTTHAIDEYVTRQPAGKTTSPLTNSKTVRTPSDCTEFYHSTSTYVRRRLVHKAETERSRLRRRSDPNHDPTSTHALKTLPTLRTVTT